MGRRASTYRGQSCTVCIPCRATVCEVNRNVKGVSGVRQADERLEEPCAAQGRTTNFS